VADKLCPKCGAYWACDCVIEYEVDVAALAMPVAEGCQHDWLDAVGVELHLESAETEAHVVVCRFCGIYAVSDVRT
jgi:hypothetical protein